MQCLFNLSRPAAAQNPVHLRTCVLLLFSAACAGWVISASAQEADDSTLKLEEFTITGSRIIRRDYDTPSPIATVTAEQLNRSGEVTVEQVLNQLPQLQVNNTSNVNAPGTAGTLTADLRGLGPSRTLVLVNGRRFAPADASGVVDLASIPQSLVERVEVVTGGASAVYGSDAIAGVVNFILKDDYTGMQAAYNYGATEHGDGQTRELEFTLGSSLDGGRGNAVLFGSYTKQEPVFQSARDFSRTSLFEDAGQLVPAGSSRVPGSVIFGTDLIYPAGAGSADCDDPIGAQFREGGTPHPYCSPQNAYNFAAPNYLLRPRERYQIAGRTHYEVTEHVRAFGEVVYLNTTNRLQQAPAAIDFELVPGSRTLPVPLDNPLIPAVTRDFLAANFDPDGDGIATLVGARRRFEETGPRQQVYERNSFQIVTGLRGDLAAHRWELFYQVGRTSTSEEFVNLVSNLRVAQGLDVIVDSNGAVSCRNASFQCLPINIFGFGSIPPEVNTFLSPTAFTKTVAQRKVAGGSLAGPLFDLPGGSVGGAVGFEYRKETAEFRPDATVASGELGLGADALPLSGSFDVKELFAELRVPLVTERPFAKYFGVEGAFRFSDYSTVGRVTTFKFGSEWAPVKDLRLRALFQRAVRAPNVAELFAGQATANPGYSDPCDVDRNPAQSVRDFCIAQGVPSGVIDSFQQDDVVASLSGGNPQLTEEKSDTYTLGLVARPRALPRLSLSIDYYKVSLDDAVTRIAVQEIIDNCFASENLGSASCALITRISNGKISQIRSYNANIATFNVSGLDLAADYTFDLPGALSLEGHAATLTAHLLASRQFERELTSSAGAPPIDCAGFFGAGVCSGQGIPIVLDFKALLGLDYKSGRLGVTLRGRYLGAVDPINADNVVHGISARIYTDLAASFALTKHLQLTAIVNNLFATQPPVLGFDNAGDSNTDHAVYDPLGRRFFVGARMTF